MTEVFLFFFFFFLTNRFTKPCVMELWQQINEANERETETARSPASAGRLNFGGFPEVSEYYLSKAEYSKVGKMVSLLVLSGRLPRQIKNRP